MTVEDNRNFRSPVADRSVPLPRRPSPPRADGELIAASPPPDRRDDGGTPTGWPRIFPGL
jgi:hypothetical protein